MTLKNNKKRELYFSMMAICLLGIYIFLEPDLLGINFNIFIRILFCIIFLMLFLEFNFQFNKLGKESIDGIEIDYNPEKIKEIIKQYKLISCIKKESFHLKKYIGKENSNKKVLIVIKTQKISEQVKEIITYSINWYKSDYLKKIQFNNKNYDLKIICICEDYDLNILSKINSQIYLTMGRAPNAIVIPVFISTLKKKAYLSGIRYLRKIEFDYYQKEKNELIKILNDKKGDVVDEKEY